jgi:hypothetical protein
MNDFGGVLVLGRFLFANRSDGLQYRYLPPREALFFSDEL